MGDLSNFVSPRHIAHLDLEKSCEHPGVAAAAIAHAFRWFAPSVRTISIAVVHGITLDFLTDEYHSLDFSALREIKMDWPGMEPPDRAAHWDGLRSWMERAGAQQLEALHLTGVDHYIDRLYLSNVYDILKEQGSKCQVVDKRKRHGARINYEHVTGGRQN